MQLVLDVDGQTERLADIHRLLRRHFGDPPTYRQLDPVSQLVLALIGGRTPGEVTASAFERLRCRFDSWSAVRDAPVARIHDVIWPVTYAENKAPRLKATLSVITGAAGVPTLAPIEDLSDAAALAWLERLPGVGRKAAAATLNFSTLRRRVLVIDTHHRRVLQRLGLLGETYGFAQAHDRIVPRLPPAWTADDLDAQHTLMKLLGQTICRHGTPDCGTCPLRRLCPTGFGRSGSNGAPRPTFEDGRFAAASPARRR